MDADFENKVREELGKLRGMLQADGGDCELVALEGKTLRLRLTGHCGSCPFAMMTLKQGIEDALRANVDPEITVERAE